MSYCKYKDCSCECDDVAQCPYATPPAAPPDDLVRRLEFHARQYASAAPLTEADDLLKAAAAIVALRERIAELEETFDTLRGNAKYQQDRAERAEADNAKLRAVVEAADAMRLSYGESRKADYDAARATLRETTPD